MVVIGGLVVGVLAAGGVLLLRRGDSKPVEPPPRAAVAPPVVPPPPAPEPLKPPPELPKTVTIQVTGAPADARITLDGIPTTLPLRLARGAEEHKLGISAPGHEPIQERVDGSQDRTIVISMPRARHASSSHAPAKAPAPPPAPAATEPKKPRDRLLDF
jgi:hypothetical protein